ncbi:PREDICTED: serine/threonine-protein kinase fray2-like isoform X2 [Lupinus angustifolius]|uniref:serine/threonine-protein kinase fray2-like isoform X2 n=1 Tax=Lupinus angustifolius TaxID=3871 RepID=UPI00092FD80F|nr:PREDICTED: serine/threonine-protein kinase fray2-like isoform X2 [Lupinus angustifolius]
MAVNTVQHSQHNNKNETNSSTLIPQMPMASPSSSTTFSVNPTDYHLLDEVGSGSTATVYRAIYLPNNRQVAVKCLDLDRFNCNLDDIRKEAQTLSLIDHPNVVSAYCSFVVEHYLWVVMPFMAQGSCLHLMKVAYREGFEEDSIASILKETLKALEYFHRQGHIHRDVKAGNILLHDNGEVKVADFGVSACMFDSGDRQRSRNTFVGTPCWMAPEVLQPGSGYNSKADIWSFGIMALELAHGHAPFSKYPPMKVLLMTIQNAPPGLDYDRDRKFSKSFKEMVAMCLVKDQTKRPSAEKLLKHSFFKNAKPPGLSVKKLFADLPPLWNRVKSLQIKDADQLAQKKTPSAEQEALSQSEYHRGVSAWNFDIDDLKAQASLVRDDDDIAEMREEFKNKLFTCYKDTTTDSLFSKCKKNSGNLKQDKFMLQVGYNDMPQSEKISGSIVERTPSILENDMEASKTKNQPPKILRTLSGPPVQSMMLGRSLSEKGHAFERFGNENQSLGEKSNRITRQAPNLSGPLMLPNRASANSLSAPIKSSGGFRDSLDDKSKANLVQIKGRFSVTSENLEPVKGSRLRKSASVGDWMSDSKQMPTSQSTKDSANTNNPASLLIPHLQNLFQQTSIQQDLIMNLWNSLQPDEAIDASQNGKLPPLPCSPENKGSVDAAALEREKLLMAEVAELQARMISLTEELTLEKLKHEQLQQQLNNAYSKERNGEKYEVS